MEKIILINDDKAISADNNEAQAAAQAARLSKTRLSVCIDQGQRHGRCRGLSGAGDAAGERAGNKAQLLSLHLFIFFCYFCTRPSSSFPPHTLAGFFLTSRRAGERSSAVYLIINPRCEPP